LPFKSWKTVMVMLAIHSPTGVGEGWPLGVVGVSFAGCVGVPGGVVGVGWPPVDV